MTPSATLANLRAEIEASIRAKQALLREEALLGQLSQLAQDCLIALRTGRMVVFAGNGGSFADAQHLAAEFTSRFLLERAPLAAMALGTNSSSMSAIGNDFGFDQVFARELRAVAKPGDVFVPISTSGNSPNILEAVRAAHSLGIRTVGFTGKDGGQLNGLCECICVPSTMTARIQECHILLGHMLCGLVEAEHFFSDAGGASVAQEAADGC